MYIMVKYLIRLDDACPTMDRAKWQRMLVILDRFGVKPMVGIIPHNEDPAQKIDEEDPEFWNMAKDWQDKGYAIALHGYNHCYISDKGLEGLNPIWERSEFAGVSYPEQYQKIYDGYSIMKQHGLNPKYFFAPSHTFDGKTLKVLTECTEIRMISDTIGNYPYQSNGFVFIPQVGGHCREMKLPGIWTFCLHPSMMNDDDFVAIENFIGRHKEWFAGFDDLDLNQLKGKNLVGKILSWAYFALRKKKGIK